jgi:arabinofuranan 3-O-arabinosyltransferase
LTTVTVVVPTRNAARTLAACLASVRAQTHPDVEVVVVDNASIDATPAIAAAGADLVERAGPERSAQRNHGWRAGTGEVVAFVDADMVLEPGVLAEAVEIFQQEPATAGLVIPELSFGAGFLARCRALEKSLYLGDAAVEAARVFRRAALERTGGYAEDLSAFEDWDLTDRFAPAQIGRTTARVWHDDGVIRLRAAFRKRRYYGRWLPVYRARPWARHRRPGHTLARLPVSPWRSRTFGLVAGLVLLKAVEAAGLARGERDAP